MERQSQKSMYGPSSSALSIDTAAHSSLHSPARPTVGFVNQRSRPRGQEEERESRQGSDCPPSQNPPWRAELRAIYTEGYDKALINLWLVILLLSRRLSQNPVRGMISAEIWLNETHLSHWTATCRPSGELRILLTANLWRHKDSHTDISSL